MSKKGLWLGGILFSAVLAFPSDHYRMAGGSGDFYFGHISYIEAKAEGNDPTILREDSVTPEPATLNTPVGPGDVIRTSDARRCEIQFDSGTIVRLDVNTELKVETILAESLSKNTTMSNLVLSSGRIYVMFKEYDHRETFQVLTSNAAVKMKHLSVTVIAVSEDGPTDVRVRAGKASVLFGPEAARTLKKDVKKHERFIVLADGQIKASEYPADTPFEAWNEEMNANFTALHRGLSPLPKPIRTLPKAVFEFAQRWGNVGEWLWDDLYGYIWRPFLDQMIYPAGSWGPYNYGHWAEVAGSMFWVPEEPWGWIPYHLGLWQWDRKLGWFWLPGSVFAPAWLAWDELDGYYYAWRAWTLFDCYLNGGYLGVPFAYGFSSQGANYWPSYWHFGPPPPYEPPGKIWLRPGQRRKQEKEAVLVSVPKEMKKAYENVVAALARKDERLIESLRGTMDRAVVVARDDLHAARLKDKALTWEKVRALPRPPAAGGGAAEPQINAITFRDALSAYRQNVAGTPPPAVDVPVKSAQRPFVGPSPAGADRFRDWNPDIRVARHLGVRIDYSSRTNEVLCPELKTSSRDIGRRGLRMSDEGLVRDTSRESSGGYDPSGTTSSGQISTVKEHDRPASQQGTKSDDGKTKRD